MRSTTGNGRRTAGKPLLARNETAFDPRADDDRPENLVARVQAGDRRAEERVVELYGRGVAILLDRHTNGRPEAQDLFQDTFRLVLEKLRNGELREPAALPGFVVQIARSLAIEHYRKAARRKTETGSEAGAEAVAPHASALNELLDHENASLVRRVLEELANERDRQILLRFYIAEEDKDRIAADYDLTSLQFNRVLHRARQRYKELFLARHGGAAAAAFTGAVLITAINITAISLLLIPLWRGTPRG